MSKESTKGIADFLKVTAIILVAVATVLGILYLTIGGTALAIVLGTVVLSVIIISAFSLGILFARSAMIEGANIANTSHQVNDRADVAKIGLLTESMRVAANLHKEQIRQHPATQPQFPPLELPTKVEDGEFFQIEGLGE